MVQEFRGPPTPHMNALNQASSQESSSEEELAERGLYAPENGPFPHHSSKPSLQLGIHGTVSTSSLPMIHDGGDSILVQPRLKPRGSINSSKSPPTLN
jgi:hypothetical protein